MKSTVKRAAVALAGACLLAATALGATPAQAASSAAFMKGTWVGPLSGFTDPDFCGGYTHCTGKEKITITKVKGHAAKGTWQYNSGGGWSAPEAVTFVVWAAADGTWSVSGSHVGGVYDGVYTPWTGVLDMAYMAPGDVGGTLFFSLTKKK